MPRETHTPIEQPKNTYLVIDSISGVPKSFYMVQQYHPGEDRWYPPIYPRVPGKQSRIIDPMPIDCKTRLFGWYSHGDHKHWYKCKMDTKPDGWVIRFNNYEDGTDEYPYVTDIILNLSRMASNDYASFGAYPEGFDKLTA